MERRIINTELRSEESVMENKLRPNRLNDYVGQRKAKENLRVYIEAAKLRGEPLDHVLFYGPPGLGKTTLACIIAEEMGVNIKVIQDVLGHKDISTTMDIYTDVTKDLKRREFNSLTDYFGSIDL